MSENDRTGWLHGIECEDMRPVTWCVVKEVRSGSWGVDGNPLTTADMKALAMCVGVRRVCGWP